MTQHQLHGCGDVRGLKRFAVDEVERHARRRRRHIPGALADGGQADLLGEIAVVESGDGQILGDTDAILGQAKEQRYRPGILVDADGGGWFGTAEQGGDGGVDAIIAVADLDGGD